LLVNGASLVVPVVDIVYSFSKRYCTRCDIHCKSCSTITYLKPVAVLEAPVTVRLAREPVVVVALPEDVNEIEVNQ
jgi:hypothetical protein